MKKWQLKKRNHPDLYYYPESMNNISIIEDKEYDPIQTKELLCDENPWLTNQNDTILKVIVIYQRIIYF